MSAALDPRRVLRALRLEVTPESHGVYRVTGGTTLHRVVVGAQGRWRCDCPDAEYRPRGRCKHVVAVYLSRQLAAPVRAALASSLQGGPLATDVGGGGETTRRSGPRRPRRPQG